MWQKIGDYFWALFNALIPIAFILWIINLDRDMSFHWHWNFINIYLLIAFFVLYPWLQGLRHSVDFKMTARPTPDQQGPLSDSRIFLTIFQNDWSSSSSLVTVFLAGVGTIFSPVLLIGWLIGTRLRQRRRNKLTKKSHRGYH